MKALKAPATSGDPFIHAGVMASVPGILVEDIPQAAGDTLQAVFGALTPLEASHRARSEEAHAKRRETLARKAQWQLDEIVLLRQYRVWTVAHIAKELGLEEATVVRKLVRLEREGRVTRPRFGRGTIESKDFKA
jgi:predicted Rossmann fold nucleotide-binding protein DprA/Smf involved in DNA uptake